MTTTTVSYMTWTASGQSFCVHPAPFLAIIGLTIACRQCGAVLREAVLPKIEA